jgi:hypothetical protein
MVFKKGHKVIGGFKKGNHPLTEFKKGNKLRLGKRPNSYIDGCSYERNHAIVNSLKRGYPIPIPLNDPFKGSSFHHIDKEKGIFILKKLHKSIYHRLSGKNLDKMNDWAFEYMISQIDKELVS